eukprot:Clim_evm128s149 gene=Clim_evmTU128s149
MKFAVRLLILTAATMAGAANAYEVTLDSMSCGKIYYWADTFDHGDFYVFIPGFKLATSEDSNDQTPEWNENLAWGQDSSRVTLEVWEYDTIGPDDHVCTHNVDITGIGSFSLNFRCKEASCTMRMIVSDQNDAAENDPTYLAGWKAVKVAQATYGNFAPAIPSLTEWHRYTTDNGADTSIVARDADNICYVSFEGSDDASDWISNINALSITKGSYTGHRGFYDEMNDVYGKVKSKHAQFLAAGYCDGGHIITGHSKGGAMANWYAAVQNDAGFFNCNGCAQLHTFGAPEVWTSASAARLATRPELDIYRWVNNFDIVSGIVAFAYKHAVEANVFYFTQRYASQLVEGADYAPSLYSGVAQHSLDIYESNMAKIAGV